MPYKPIGLFPIRAHPDLLTPLKIRCFGVVATPCIIEEIMAITRVSSLVNQWVNENEQALILLLPTIIMFI